MRLRGNDAGYYYDKSDTPHDGADAAMHAAVVFHIYILLLRCLPRHTRCPASPLSAALAPSRRCEDACHC